MVRRVPVPARRRESRGRTAVRLALAAGAMGVASLAMAAESSAPGGFVLPKPRPATTAAAATAAPAPPPSAVPYAPPSDADTGTPRGHDVALYLVAKLTEEGGPVSSGMTWRVFRETPDETGKLPLVATAVGGDAEFRLAPGGYLVHAAFGKAGAVSHVRLERDVVSETLVMDAGGMKLDVVVDENDPVPADAVAFDVYAAGTGERDRVAENVKPGIIVRLPAGTYHVVSRYGAVNAVMRADIEIQPGKLTEATLHHRAAEVTLKLVSEAGGEAVANTHWSVLSMGGDVVVEAVGAFPTFILAEGEYAVVAKNGGTVFNATFDVEAGRDRDVEVIADEAAARSSAEDAAAAAAAAAEPIPAGVGGE